MTRLLLAGAVAGALASLAPAAAGAQDGHVALLAAAPTTVGGPAAPDTTGAEAVPRRPDERAVAVRRAPTYRRHAISGAAIGTGVGLAVGLLAYRNNQRKCHDCIGNDAIPVLVTGAGTVLGLVGGTAAYVLRERAAGDR